jgi:hypothetical protein
MTEPLQFISKMKRSALEVSDEGVISRALQQSTRNLIFK